MKDAILASATNAQSQRRRLRVNDLLLLAISLVAFSGCVSHPRDARPTAIEDRPYGEVALWEADIEAFEAVDQMSPPAPGSIVFVGSSSIVFWKSLGEDLAPLPVVNRGFGGSRIYDAVYYADRIVWPYEPRAIVMFSGSNDIIEPDPAAPAKVQQGLVDFIADTRVRFPDIDIHYISITPTRARWSARKQVFEANERIAALAERDERIYFIDTASKLMKNGEPDPRFFVDDRLHLNGSGYAVWTSVIRPHLMTLYGPD